MYVLNIFVLVRTALNKLIVYEMGSSIPWAYHRIQNPRTSSVCWRWYSDNIKYSPSKTSINPNLCHREVQFCINESITTPNTEGTNSHAMRHAKSLGFMTYPTMYTLSIEWSKITIETAHCFLQPQHWLQATQVCTAHFHKLENLVGIALCLFIFGVQILIMDIWHMGLKTNPWDHLDAELPVQRILHTPDTCTSQNNCQELNRALRTFSWVWTCVQGCCVQRAGLSETQRVG